MFVEKTDSVLGDVLSCPCGVESRLVSTGLEMSSSWISVMQASLGDLMPMSQMFVGCRSLIDCLFFFFFFSVSISLLDLFVSLFRAAHKVDLNFGGFFFVYSFNTA